MNDISHNANEIAGPDVSAYGGSFMGPVALKNLTECGFVPVESQPKGFGQVMLPVSKNPSFPQVKESQGWKVHGASPLDPVNDRCIPVQLEAHSNKNPVQGTWSLQERLMSLNLRELRAICLHLQHFAPQLRGKDVTVRTDQQASGS